MKKIFFLTSTKITPERQIEAVKGEIKKYLARERRKKLPEGMNKWGFDCKVGVDLISSEVVQVADIKTEIDRLAKEGQTQVYVEIIAKPLKKSVITAEDKDDTSDIA